jgi:hypothetical protein
MYEGRLNAYNAVIDRGASDFRNGEAAFTTAANTRLPELDQMAQDISSGNATNLNQGMAQMNSSLAAQGVRGGQAAGLLNRAAGQMATDAQKDVNQISFDEANARAAELRAYQANKAKSGQTATYTTFGG